MPGHMVLTDQHGVCRVVNMSKAAILESFTNIDTLAAVAAITITAANLRAGMVLVDDLGCPVVGIDHRVKATRNSGGIAFLGADLDNGGWNRIELRRTVQVKVMAA
jgi:hypothetical protein